MTKYGKHEQVIPQEVVDEARERLMADLSSYALTLTYTIYHPGTKKLYTFDGLKLVIDIPDISIDNHKITWTF